MIPAHRWLQKMPEWFCMHTYVHEYLTTHTSTVNYVTTVRLVCTENKVSRRPAATPRLPWTAGALSRPLSFWSYIRPSIRGNVDYVTADPLPRLPPGKVKKATALCSSRRLGFSRFSRGRPNAKLDVCDLLRGPDMPATQPGHLRQHISTAPSQRNFTAS